MEELIKKSFEATILTRKRQVFDTRSSYDYRKEIRVHPH